MKTKLHMLKLSHQLHHFLRR